MDAPQTLTVQEVKAHFAGKGIITTLKIELVVIADRMYKRDGDHYYLLGAARHLPEDDR